jgi:orotidine-5'-phosphate decarboxylase
MRFDPGNRLIAALDVPDRRAAEALVARLGGAADWLKVGLELFCAEGPDLVRSLAATGARIMLDLKLHDIPETVARAVARASALGAGLLTVHTTGGRAMLQAAVDASRDANATGRRTRILAVTVLTSMDEVDLAEIGTAGPVEELVVRRAQLAMEVGCDGVVASAHEAERLRRGAPEDFLIVTPGIRPHGEAAADQKRVMTPRDARLAGADLIVVGRPIRDAADPAAMARQIAAELARPT